MMPVVRRPAAEADLLEIWRYVAADDDVAADRLLDRFDAALAMLAATPHAGRARPELADGVRSFAVGRYVLFYTPVPDGIALHRVLHSARDLAAQTFD